MTTETIDLLLVEDNAGDADLMRIMLRTLKAHTADDHPGICLPPT